MDQQPTALLGPRQCINCNVRLLPDAIFCHRCGTRQPSPTITLRLVEEADAPPFVLEDAGIKHVVGRTIEPLEHYVQIDLGPHRGKEQGVSRSHAEIWFDDTAFCWQLQDVGSQFGTFVDEEQLSEEKVVALKSGQMVRFGGIQLTIELEY
jgi:hypothetical protein